MSHSPLTVGVGAALVDLLLEEKDEFLKDFGEKGGMTLVERELIEKALSRASSDVDRKSTRLNSSHMSESRMPSSA